MRKIRHDEATLLLHACMTDGGVEKAATVLLEEAGTGIRALLPVVLAANGETADSVTDADQTRRIVIVGGALKKTQKTTMNE